VTPELIENTTLALRAKRHLASGHLWQHLEPRNCLLRAGRLAVITQPFSIPNSEPVVHNTCKNRQYLSRSELIMLSSVWATSLAGCGTT
jgi:hypothetical protein